MRVITLNANGIRSAERKGFFQWLARARADVVCIQEIKAQHEKIVDPVFHPKQFHCFYHPAERPGYSGVALFAKTQPERVTEGFGSAEFDPEGRYIEAHFKDFSVVSLYAPSGSSSEARQEAKYRFLDSFMKHLRRRKNKPVLICGDWNIAHREIDLKNWRSNQKNSGFLPEERAWMDTLFDGVGYVDCFRSVKPDAAQYTWWSNRGRARENDVGWRIDYQIASPAWTAQPVAARVYRDRWFSDHAPLIMDYEP